MPISKRQFIITLPMLGAVAACKPTNEEQIYANATSVQRRFKGLSAILVVDVVKGAEMLGVEFFADDSDFAFYTKSAQVYRDTTSYPSGVLVPIAVRVTWRKSDKYAQISWGSSSHYDENGKSKEGYIPRDGAKLNADEEIARLKAISLATGVPHYGPWTSRFRDEVVGDYTIPVAPRIPDEFIKAARLKGGSLCLKFRLHPEGVLFGWEMELRVPLNNGTGLNMLRYEMPDGDFHAAPLIYRLDGKVDRGKGWYIHPKTGQKIETDF